MTQIEIRSQVYRKLLQAQRIYRLVNSARFETAYGMASEEDKQRMQEAVDNLDRTSLYIMMKRLLELDLENWTVTDLRELGYALSIPNYQYKTKDVLIEDIMKKKLQEKE